MVAKSKTVDVLSLWLSLKDNSSERVQMALEEAMTQVLGHKD
jgi:hypothetical protein